MATDKENEGIWLTSNVENGIISPIRTSEMEYRTIIRTVNNFDNFTFGDFGGGYGLFGLVIGQDFEHSDVSIINTHAKGLAQCKFLKNKLGLDHIQIINKKPNNINETFDITFHGLPTFRLLESLSPQEIASTIARSSNKFAILEAPSQINDKIAKKLLGDKINLIEEVKQHLMNYFQIMDCQPLVSTNKQWRIVRMCYILAKRPAK